jgi:hypothetical protein
MDINLVIENLKGLVLIKNNELHVLNKNDVFLDINLYFLLSNYKKNKDLINKELGENHVN